MTTSDLHFVLTMFLLCIGCFVFLTILFGFLVRAGPQKANEGSG